MPQPSVLWVGFDFKNDHLLWCLSWLCSERRMQPSLPGSCS